MDDVLGPDQPGAGGGADDPLADRYAIGAQMGQNDQVQTFRATDHWLDRPVVMVVETGSGRGGLAETCQAMAGVLSPNLVDIYDRGDRGGHPFAVCELPMSTVASLAEDPDQSLWNEGWAIDTAKQLAVALADLHRSGVDTSGLHFGHIGIDASGRVRLSPWPLAEPPGSSPAPASPQELVEAVLESGAQVGRSSGSSKAAELVASLRQTSLEDVRLAPFLLPGAIAGIGTSVDDKPSGVDPHRLDLPPEVLAALEGPLGDKPTGDLPPWPDPPAISAISADDEPSADAPLDLGLSAAAFDGLEGWRDDQLTGDLPPRLDPLLALGALEASADDQPTGDVPPHSDRPSGGVAGLETSVYDEPTGEVPVVSAVPPAEEALSPVDHRRHRRRWPVVAGVGVAGLAAFLAVNLSSSNPPAPAGATTNGAGACAGKAKPCPAQTVSKSASTTIPPVAPPTTTTSTTTRPTTTTTTPARGSGSGAAPPVIATTTTVPPTIATTTTTTVAPTTTTTTTVAPPTTTTTTVAPPTTTTTTTAPAGP